MTKRFNVNETLERLSKLDLKGGKLDALNKQASIYNLIYNNHWDYLTNIVTNLFKWEGLPNSKRYNRPIRSSFWESMLAFNGASCIADVPQYGIVLSPCNVEGTLDIDGEPQKINLVSEYNVSHFTSVKSLNITLDADKDKFVYFRNDNNVTGFASLVLETCYNLTIIFMSFLSNINQQKFPVVVTGSADQKLSMEIMTNKMDSFESYILLEQGQDGIAETKVLNKDMPYVGEKLWQAYNDVLNNFFLRVGINMLPNAKKERMLVDEVNSNNQAVNMAGEIYLSNRQEGCEACNEIFGMNLSVKRNVDFIQERANVNTSLMGQFTRGGEELE